MTIVLHAALAAAMVGLCADAHAQMYEIVGTRAQGMGGAFVAVANDATATWWNPAGVATGANVSIVYDRATTAAPIEASDEGPAWLGQGSGFAFAYPALGLSYYRLHITEIRPFSSNAGGDPGRQDQGAAGVDLRTLSVREFGATITQTAGPHLAVASTLKLIRAGRAASMDAGAGSARDRLEAFASTDVSHETETDLDIGAMVSLGRTRVGVSVKHVREPEFGEGDAAFEMKRQARVGAAFFAGGAPVSITAAVDADVTSTATALGDVRHLAAGAEAWLFERRIGVRGGVSSNTVGDVGNSASVGISVGSRSGYYLDGAITMGSDKSREGWALSLRLSF
jgi:hypothetical protein